MEEKNVEISTYEFNKNSISDLSSAKFNNYPVVYILHNDKKKSSAYIGETVQIRNRLNSHIKDPVKSKLEKAVIVSHDLFNQSATYNIETNLINFFIADQKYQILNKSQITSAVTHNYYDKPKYNHDIFKELWEKLREDKLVDGTLEYLQNKDIFKLSPYKELSESQIELKENILDFCKRNIKSDKPSVYFIKGEAGTGKSVVLSSTFNAIQDLSYTKDSNDLQGTENYLLVNHEEMIKTYKAISDSLPNLKKKNFMKPTSFITASNNEKINPDITLIDEAHLLLSSEDAFNGFKGVNHLNDIIHNSKVTIIVFDEKQFLKLKSYWTEELFNEITQDANVETFELTDQFRIQADTSVVDWIDNFVARKVTSIPKSTGDYELKIFDDAGKMFEAIDAKNDKHKLSRIVATFDYEHKKDGGDYYVEEIGFKGLWNTTNDSRTWAERRETIKEVGSIYTVQGFDLNYVGVILGPSVSYNEMTEQLEIISKNYKDKGAFQDFKNKSVEYIVEDTKEQIILNSINVLMKRGVKGLYIYASDDKLRKALNKAKRGEL
ncbi:hypothetical protein JEOAER750_01867 [Jeotgalicoccus aerolatus]|uniref:DUF2075 family protein/predicted GIY-YIG superfamily endonuclease n=1 Tax=Jeotgalicoccus aerolatus TaxID=709510 RepID=A0ABS4HJH0_9STAP|nr:DUF2075 domain-containing protein [Jeotgalicoccus aerolatus]MBP1951075.1 DUF2075 family protein/predicted GIY-YIG superfamily endonuclease [Jeotgalicoccus aerolatus]GGE00440.1 hypothetical protein GCM10007273_11050 [Jeotgalicoccus aerolatus]CAD2078238.1 hypothetical protein JEOAER750_01867 [Jeotgalicoccus aerolatus]